MQTDNAINASRETGILSGDPQRPKVGRFNPDVAGAGDRVIRAGWKIGQGDSVVCSGSIVLKGGSELRVGYVVVPPTAVTRLSCGGNLLELDRDGNRIGEARLVILNCRVDRTLDGGRIQVVRDRTVPTWCYHQSAGGHAAGKNGDHKQESTETDPSEAEFGDDVNTGFPNSVCHTWDSISDVPHYFVSRGNATPKAWACPFRRIR